MRDAAASGVSLQATGLPGVYQARGDSGALAGLARQIATLPGLGYVEPMKTYHVARSPNDPKLTDGTSGA